MAQIISDENTDKKFAKEPCDKTLLLGSLRDYAPDGVIMGVEKLLTPKKNDFGKVTLSVIFTIIGTMPKCRLYNLDEEGQYKFVKDDMTGENRREVVVTDGNLATVFFPFYADCKDKEIDENSVLIVTPGTSSYSFFKEGLIDAGELPEDTGNVAFSTSFKELKEALDGFTFKGKYAKSKSKNKFEFLDVERVEN